MNVSTSIRLKARRAMSPPLYLGPDKLAPLDDVALSGRMPHVSAGFFFDSAAAETMLRRVVGDRRMTGVTSHVAPGGIAGATAHFATAPSPDLLVLETMADGPGILADLEELARVCDNNTKVIVIGRPNDIGLYRKLIANGISDYLIAPVDSLFVIAASLKLYQNGTTAKSGRISAFLGAKGGVGTSTLAQNIAWRIGQDRCGPVMLADLDLQFGTAALNLNLDPSVGISEQTLDAERLDEALLERTLLRRGRYLHVLPASGRMQEIDFPSPAAVEKLLDLSRKAFPVVILDLPHLQSHWMKAALAAVDDLVIVAAPDLANLRNAKCLIDMFRKSRPNDAPPKLVLNQVGIARRAGLAPADFARGAGVEVAALIDFEPQVFATAANDGLLVAETSPRGAAARAISALAREFDARRAPDSGGARRKPHWFQLPWRSGD